MIQARKVSVPKQNKKEFASPSPKVRKKIDVKTVFARREFHLYGILLACIILAVAAVGQYCKLVTTNFAIGQEESRVEMLLEEQRELKKEYANLNSLVRIEHIARNELAMEEARELQIMTASSETEY